MNNKLYRNNFYLQEKETDYPIECNIDSIEAMKDCVAYDHIAANLNGQGRCSNNYQSSNIFMIDIDNDHTNNPEEWMTIEDFTDKFKDYKFYIATSKSHNVDKLRSDNKPRPNDSARPRFHVYFLLSHDLNSTTYPSSLKTQKFFDVVDKKALDKSRLFYGNPTSKVFFNQGSGKDIISEIEKIKIDITIEKTVQTDSKLSDHGRKQVLFYLSYLNDEGFFEDYGTWFNLGVALKSSGFSIEDWFSLSWGNEGNNENRHKWNGFKDDKISLGTLIYWIRENVPGQSSWTPEYENEITVDDTKSYKIVDIDSFISDMNEKWVKTINNKGTVIRNLHTDNDYLPKAVEELHDEYIYKDGEKYRKAYSEWFSNTVAVETIKKSSNKNGLTLEDGEKIHYIFDDEINKNFLPTLSNDIIEEAYLRNINNKVPYLESSYPQISRCLNKGYLAGYTYCFSALTGIGKTWFLLNEAVNVATNLNNTMSREYKILYVSTEMNLDKIFERIIGIYYDEKDVHASQLKFMADKRNGKNILENFGFYFADRGISTDILLEQINPGQYEAIFIDYLDDFEPTRKTEIEYKKHRIISEDFTELAIKLNVPVITATQSNRSDSNEDGSTKKNRGFSSIGDGYQKTHKMAVVWNIIKESDEVSATYRGLVSQKNRDVPNPPDCHFNINESGRLVEIANSPKKALEEVTKKIRQDIQDKYEGKNVDNIFAQKEEK